jgi:hypothetical protein
MGKLFEGISLFLERVFPIVLLAISIYIYNQILKENKKLSDKVESLTSLVSYKTSELINLVKEKDSKK